MIVIPFGSGNQLMFDLVNGLSARKSVINILLTVLHLQITLCKVLFSWCYKGDFLHVRCSWSLGFHLMTASLFASCILTAFKVFAALSAHTDEFHPYICQSSSLYSVLQIV